VTAWRALGGAGASPTEATLKPTFDRFSRKDDGVMMRSRMTVVPPSRSPRRILLRGRRMSPADNSHLLHLVQYERAYALPTMRHWLGPPPPGVDLMFPDMDQEDTLWQRDEVKGPELGELQQRFRSARREQIEVTQSIPD
jgi:hypothetical protein